MNHAMSDNKLYDILGVSRTATFGQIKKSYYDLAKKNHPDKNPQAGEAFKEISNAYEILSDPRKRSMYDNFGMEAFESSPAPDMFSPGSFFRRQCTPTGRDTVHPLKVSLEDLYRGKTSKLQLNKNIICSNCRGNGSMSGECVQCAACNGYGFIKPFSDLGFFMQASVSCDACRGNGTIILNPCTFCTGTGVRNDSKILEVHVDKGMRGGQKITFRREGDQQPGVVPGDVVIVLSLKEHDVFQRKDDDLEMSLTISLADALCGFNKMITHLDGRKVVLKHEPGEVIKPGDFKCVLGEGMPVYRSSGEKGHLYVWFDIVFPPSHSISDSNLSVIETLLPARPKVEIPDGEDVEEVYLSEMDPNVKQDNWQQAAYEEDDDDAGFGGIQCAAQ